MRTMLHCYVCTAMSITRDVDVCTDGGLIAGLSSLTNRLWTGEVLYFSSCTKDTATSESVAGLPLDCGVSDVKWIGTTQRFVAACDSGLCIVVDISVCQCTFLVWF